MNELDYKMLHPKSKISMYISSIVISAVCAAIMLPVVFLTDFPSIADIGILALLGVILIYEFVSPIIYYKRYRYAITDDRIDIRKGVIIVSHTVVPIERLHQVEVKRGPINNMLGLADVQVVTAGSSVYINYLENQVAEEIINELNEVINNILRGRNVGN